MAARQGLADRHDVRRGAGARVRPARPRPEEAGGDFVEDQHEVVRVAKPTQRREIARVVEVHGVGGLEHRLADNAGEFAPVLVAKPFHRGDLLRQPGLIRSRRPCDPRPGQLDGRLLGEVMPRHHAPEKDVHAIGVRKRHRTGRVAVVAALEREHLAAPGPALRLLVLDRHLDCDFDRDRARVGEEDAVEPRRRDSGETLRQLDRRRMGEPAEHDVRQTLGLPAHGFHDMRMAVPVRHAPPARHGVDQARAVGETQRHSRGGSHLAHRRRIPQRSVRMPDVRTVVFEAGHGKSSEKSTSGSRPGSTFGTVTTTGGKPSRASWRRTAATVSASIVASTPGW